MRDLQRSATHHSDKILAYDLMSCRLRHLIGWVKPRRGIFPESAEAELLIAIRRTKLDRLETSVSKLLDGGGGNPLRSTPAPARSGSRWANHVGPQIAPTDERPGNHLPQRTSLLRLEILLAIVSTWMPPKVPTPPTVGANKLLSLVGIGNFHAGTIPSQLLAAANGHISKEQCFRNHALKFEIASGFLRGVWKSRRSYKSLWPMVRKLISPPVTRSLLAWLQ